MTATAHSERWHTLAHLAGRAMGVTDERRAWPELLEQTILPSDVTDVVHSWPTVTFTAAAAFVRTNLGRRAPKLVTDSSTNAPEEGSYRALFDARAGKRQCLGR